MNRIILLALTFSFNHSLLDHSAQAANATQACVKFNEGFSTTYQPLKEGFLSTKKINFDKPSGPKDSNLVYLNPFYACMKAPGGQGDLQKSGYTLTEKMLEFLKNGTPEQVALYEELIRSGWESKMEAQPNRKSWEGSCHNFAWLSQNTSVNSLIQGAGQASVCNGTLFSSFEIKEMLLSLATYKKPKSAKKAWLPKSYQKTVAHNSKVDMDVINSPEKLAADDANATLMELGVYGGVGPHQFFEFIQKQKESGKTVSSNFSTKKGEIYNHPVKAYCENEPEALSVEDSSFLKSLSMANIGMVKASKASKENRSMLSALKSMESILVTSAKFMYSPQKKGSLKKRWEKLLSLASQSNALTECAGPSIQKIESTVSEELSLSIWQEGFANIKSCWVKANPEIQAALSERFQVEKVSSNMEYQDYSEYGASENKTKQKKLQFTRVVDLQKGRLISSQWLAETTDPNNNPILKNLVPQGRYKKIANEDSIPPVSIEAWEDRKFEDIKTVSPQDRAFKMAYDLFKSCDNANEAAEFLNQLDLSLKDGSLSGDYPALRVSYNKGKDFIDLGCVERKVGAGLDRAQLQ